MVASEMLPVFTFAMKAIVKGLGRDDAEARELQNGVVIGDLKDPVRIHEKAIDEYGTRFSDGEMPEACVSDVLRARCPCKTGTQVLQLVTLFTDGAKVAVEEIDQVGIIKDGTLDGGEPDKDDDGNPKPKPVRKKVFDPETGEEVHECIEITMVQLINRFADLDPTHFRHAVCILKLTFRMLSIFVEVEVHYEDVMRIALDPNNQAYGHYNFFRMRLAGTVPEEELDTLLEEKLVFLVDATGIPVLLSLLVLIFTSGGEDLTKLPSNRIELYELGIESAISKRLQRRGADGEAQQEGTDMLIHDWARLFNLDRGQSSQTVVNKDKEKKERGSISRHVRRR